MTNIDKDGWLVSSFSNGAGSCVQVNFATQGEIMVRDSKDRRATSPIISMSSRGWAELLNNIGNNQA